MLPFGRWIIKLTLKARLLAIYAAIYVQEVRIHYNRIHISVNRFERHIHRKNFSSKKENN